MTDSTRHNVGIDQATADKPGNHSMANRIFGIGLFCGIMANLLLRDGAAIGPGFTLWLSLLSLAASLLIRGVKINKLYAVLFYSFIALLASAIPVMRSTPILLAGSYLVIITAAGMVFMTVANIDLFRSSVLQQLIYMLKVPLRAGFAFFFFIGDLRFIQSVSNPRIAGVIRGLLIAAPLLLVFALLFAAADAVVDRLLQDVIDELSATLIQRVAITIVFGWLAAGLLAGLFITDKPAPQLIKDRIRLGNEELIVVMGLLVILFLGFVLLQTTYLFGGRETIEATTGLTLAEYARRGFFELLWVAGLTLVVLLTVLATGPNVRIFKPLAVVLVVCVLVMVVSAGQRLGIYIDEFGLTIDRLIASAVMTWLALGLILFAFLILKNSSSGLAVGISHSGIATVFILAIINPAAIVTEVNFARAAASATRVDAEYILTLNADAVPALLRHIDIIQREDYCAVSSGLLQNWGRDSVNIELLGLDDWRSWNKSRARAVQAVQQHSARLQAMTAGCDTNGL